MTPKVNLGKSISQEPSFPSVMHLINSDTKYKGNSIRNKSKFNPNNVNKSLIAAETSPSKNIALPNLKLK